MCTYNRNENKCNHVCVCSVYRYILKIVGEVGRFTVDGYIFEGLIWFSVTNKFKRVTHRKCVTKAVSFVFNKNLKK